MQESGVGGLYRGLGAGLLRQATYTTARLGIHQIFTTELKKANDGKALPLWQKAGAGLAAGGLGALVGSPADLSLVRMQVCTSRIMRYYAVLCTPPVVEQHQDKYCICPSLSHKAVLRSFAVYCKTQHWTSDLDECRVFLSCFPISWWCARLLNHQTDTASAMAVAVSPSDWY